MADKIRVLYVDDEATLLEVGKTFLERDGAFSVDTAISPGAARAILAQEAYDAIVSDYQMPEEDGISFLRSVRSRPAYTPFILFTGKGREEVVIQAIESGADFYLQKGGDTLTQFAELAHKIRQAVAKHQEALRRKDAETALRESEARFSQLFRNSPVGISLVDAADNTFVDVNETFQRTFGYTREEIIGRSVDPRMFVNPRVFPYILAELQVSGRVSGKEIPFRDKNGDIRTCFFSLTKIAMGKKTYYLSSAMDISERKAMEAQLRENQCLLAEAMDLAQLASWERDSRTGIFTFNDRFYALCGTTAEKEGGYQMDGETYFREFVHPEDLATVLEDIRRASVSSSQTYAFFTEHRLIRRDRAVRTIVVRVRVEMDSDGTVIRTHGVNQDITERCEAGFSRSPAGAYRR